ncbi:ABC-three component system protein [uncultured Clostridium sp.]|uniref:ABC-three component system protein n=1 Tax=uncultured Clostridium sp. TaxID=59620 RepID=UPI0025F18F9C|nr:ABC-three component system protein [uncultured Clostridium sp.]
MLNKENITQQAISNKEIIQSANDTNIITNIYNLSYDNFYFYEQDIKDVIIFFNKNINNITQTDFPLINPVKLTEKNILNKMSLETFNSIKNKDLSYFGKIRSFLKNPKNEEYVTMYNNTTTDLQEIVKAHIGSIDTFDKIFLSLYQYIISKSTDDKDFMKIRTKILLFLHFMYYNCDIGLNPN